MKHVWFVTDQSCATFGSRLVLSFVCRGGCRRSLPRTSPSLVNSPRTGSSVVGDWVSRPGRPVCLWLRGEQIVVRPRHFPWWPSPTPSSSRRAIAADSGQPAGVRGATQGRSGTLTLSLHLSAPLVTKKSWSAPPARLMGKAGRMATSPTRPTLPKRPRDRSSSRPRAEGLASSQSSGSAAVQPPGLEPEVQELLLNRPVALAPFLASLGVQTCADIRHMWSSGQALVAEFEASAGRLSADQAFSVAALWTLALSRATTQGHKGIAAIVEDRTSVFSKHTAPRPEPGQPTKVVTYRKLIQAGGTPEPPSFARAAATDPYAKEQSVRVAKMDASFQMLMEDVVDAAELGLTVDNLQDAGSIQSLKESLMATPNQLSTERVGSLMAALKRWKRFALPRKYPLRAPTPLQVAEFLRDVSRGGPTAAASVWQALKWFKEKMGMQIPCDHFLVLPYKNFPTAYSSTQAVELQPWELVNLILFARQQRGTNLVLICFILQCSVSCIRFEHFQRSRLISHQAEWARFWCRQGKRRVRGARPGYEWATPELAWQGFSLLKVLTEFFKHECLTNAGFLWPQVQLDPQDLWEIHEGSPFNVAKPMSRQRFLEILRGALHQIGVPIEEATTATFNKLRRFMPTLANVLRLDAPELQAVGSWIEIPAAGGPSPTTKSRATWIMGRHYAGGQTERSAAVKRAILQRFWKLFHMKQGEIAMTDQHLLPRGSWTWPELAVANDRLGPLEIAPMPVPEGAIQVDNPDELAAMELPADKDNPAHQAVEEEPEPIHSDSSSSTTSTSASDVSAAGSDMEGVVVVDAAMDQAMDSAGKQDARGQISGHRLPTGALVPWLRLSTRRQASRPRFWNYGQAALLPALPCADAAGHLQRCCCPMWLDDLTPP